MGEEIKEKSSMTKEELELRYEKLYPDLSKDAIKMLINTHPLYNEEEKLEEKKPKKKKAKRTEEVTEKDEDDEEKFINDLFSDEKENDSKDTIRYFFTLVSVIINVVCIIAIVVMFNNNKSIKGEMEKLEADKMDLSLKYEEIQLQKDYSSQENQRLQTIITQLQAEIDKNSSNKTQQNNQMQQDNQTQQNQNNSNENPDASNDKKEDAQGNTQTEEKIYVVKKGESLWKISQTVYGNGNYYKKIMEYNNLESEIVKEGMKLKIPNIE